MTRERGDAATRKAAPPQRRRWLKLLLLVLAVAWMTRFAYTRLTATPERPCSDLPAALQRIEAGISNLPPDKIVAQFDVCPGFGYTLPTPSEGRRWATFFQERPVFREAGETVGAEWDEALRGPWDPAARPMLAAAISELGSEARRARLALLRAAADDAGSDTAAVLAVRPWRMKAACHLLLADARYQRVQHGDAAQCWADIKAALLLSRRLTNDAHVAIQREALREIQLWLLEDPPSVILLQAIESHLSATPSLERVWADIVNIRRQQHQTLIDASFTCDEQGDGWLVLSVIQEVDAHVCLHMCVSEPRRTSARPWNLLSPLFCSRRDAVRRADDDIERMRHMLAMDCADLLKQATALGRRRIFCAAYGPHLNRRGGEPADDLTLCAALDALYSELAAARIAVALQRCKAETSRYPSDPEDLVPHFLPSVPVAPSTAPPIRYELTDDTYELWTVEPDQDEGVVSLNRAASREPAVDEAQLVDVNEEGKP